MGSFSEKIIVEALERRDWRVLRAELESMDFDEESADKIVHLVLQARKLVFRYPGPVKKRTEILDGVAGLIRDRFGTARASRATQAFAVFTLIDEGYAGLRTLIGANPLAAHEPPHRVAASLDFFAMQADSMRRQASENAATEAVGGRILLTDPEGGQFSVDAATSKFVEFATMAIKIEAYSAGWIGEDTIIKVPYLPEVEADAVVAAGGSMFTAFAWQQWQSVEERVRYFGDALFRRPATEVDATLPSEADVLQHVVESLDWQIIDAIANERLGDRLSQTYQDLLEQTHGHVKFDGLSGRSDVLPRGRLSLAEAHSATMLSQLLGFDTASDQTEYGGLTLMEWLRGYAVLQLVAQEAVVSGSTPRQRWFPRRKIGGLHGLLRRKGLIGEKASNFVAHVSFAESSRDLYDAPLIRLPDNTCILAALAMSGALLLRLLLSTFAAKGYVIQQKGKAFEEYVRIHLRGQGLRAEHVRTSRGGAEFEFDALVPWGGYLFLFECKNRSLSANNVVSSYRFFQEVKSSAKQVKRLVAALEAHPDIIGNCLGADALDLQIVPVVLHSMPFSIPGGVDGVYFWDASAMTRFFREKFVNASVLHSVGERLLKHRVPTHALWRGERPTPEDLLEQLRKPVQVEMLNREMKVEPLGFSIGIDLFAATVRPRRKSSTLETTLAGTVLTPEAVRSEFERFEREIVTPLREKLGMDVSAPTAREFRGTS